MSLPDIDICATKKRIEEVLKRMKEDERIGRGKKKKIQVKPAQQPADTMYVNCGGRWYRIRL